MTNVKPDSQQPRFHAEPGLATLRRGALAIFFIALLVRLAYYFELSGKPYFGVPLLDSRWWLQEARELMNAGLPSHAFFRPPLYTSLLAVTTMIFGENAPLLIPLFQLIVGAAFCAAMVYLGAYVWNLAGGLAAGCLAALYAPLVFYEAEILSDSITLFWLALFLIKFIRGVQDRHTRDFLLAGLFAGLAALTRANALPIAVMLLLGYVVSAARQHSLRRDVKPLAALALALLLCVAIPTLHNWRANDPVIICGQGGINFFIGNNPDANGVNIIIPRLTEQGERYRDTVEEFAAIGYLADQFGFDQARLRYAAGERPKWRDLDRFWYAQGISFWLKNPREAANLYLKKLVALLNNRETRNNRDFQLARAQESLVLRLLPFSFALVLALAANGLRAWKRGERPGPGWLLLYLFASCIVVIAYIVAGRLRIIVLPALFVFGGIGVERIFQALAARDRREFARACATVLVVGTASCYSWPQLDFRYSHDQMLGDGIAATAFPAGEWAMLANACLENGHPDEAIAYAERALASDPTFSYAWLVLGNSYLAKGKPEAALFAYARALANEPLSQRVRNNLAVAFEKLGHYQKAAEVYLDVLRADPAEPRANANLAALLFRSGDRGAARSFAQTALDSDADQMIAQAVVNLTQNDGTQGSTATVKAQPLPTSILEELRSALPQRIDLTSTRTTEQVLADLGMTSASLRRVVVPRVSHSKKITE
jgi:tetratricopeptide (TPR) repeat protein